MYNRVMCNLLILIQHKEKSMSTEQQDGSWDSLLNEPITILNNDCYLKLAGFMCEFIRSNYLTYDQELNGYITN